MPPPAFEDPAAADFAGLARIKTLARWVRLLSLLGIVVVLSMPPVLWSDPDWLMEIAGQQWSLRHGTALQLDSTSRMAGLAASWLPAGVAAYALYQVWSLFGCYGRGEVFGGEPVLRLRRIGLALMWMAIARPVGATLCVLALTLGNPPGQRMLSFTVAWMDYLALLIGLMLLAIATVMREAGRAARENAEFI